MHSPYHHAGCGLYVAINHIQWECLLCTKQRQLTWHLQGATGSITHLPAPRCYGQSVTLLPHCPSWKHFALSKAGALHRKQQHRSGRTSLPHCHPQWSPWWWWHCPFCTSFYLALRKHSSSPYSWSWCYIKSSQIANSCTLNHCSQWKYRVRFLWDLKHFINWPCFMCVSLERHPTLCTLVIH